MNKIFFTLIVMVMAVFLISFASAEGGIGKVCIDLDPPTWSENSSLNLIIIDKNIQLSWTSATDIPACSGISHYDIYKGFNGGDLGLIDYSEDTNYLDIDDFPAGTYTYMIHAWDLVGHLEGPGISDSIILEEVTPPRRGRRGPSSYWECGEWSECINETQERTCEDISRLRADRVETRDCVPEFIPTGQEPEENETITLTTTSPGFFATITGAVVGTLGTSGTIVVSVFIIAVVALAIVFSVKGRKK